jgi:hypothetical protein
VLVTERVYVLGYPKIDGIEDLARFQRSDRGLVSGELNYLAPQRGPQSGSLSVLSWTSCSIS